MQVRRGSVITAEVSSRVLGRRVGITKEQEINPALFVIFTIIQIIFLLI